MKLDTLYEISPNLSARSIKRDLAELKSSYSKAEVLVTYRINRSHPAVKDIDVVSHDCNAMNHLSYCVFGLTFDNCDFERN